MAAKKKADAAVENTAEVTQETTEQVQDTVEQMTEDNKKELDNKKFVVDHLLSTKREGMEDLIDYMEQIGFFEAPCSGGNHLACQFGLVHHSRNVMMAAENIGYALLGKVTVLFGGGICFINEFIITNDFREVFDVNGSSVFGGGIVQTEMLNITNDSQETVSVQGTVNFGGKATDTAMITISTDFNETIRADMDAKAASGVVQVDFIEIKTT